MIPVKFLKQVVISVAIFFLASCAKKNPDLLDINRMKVVLLQTQMAKEYISSNYLIHDTTLNKDSLYSVFYSKVFSLNHIDSIQYINTLNYYKTDPEKFKVLLDSANNYGTREREKRFNINSANNSQHLPDSLVE